MNVKNRQIQSGMRSGCFHWLQEGGIAVSTKGCAVCLWNDESILELDSQDANMSQLKILTCIIYNGKLNHAKTRSHFKNVKHIKPMVLIRTCSTS